MRRISADWGRQWHLCLSGCDYHTAQNINGIFIGHEATVSGKQIALAKGKNAKDCSKLQLTGIIDDKGKFTFSRNIRRSVINPYAQSDALCIYENNLWNAIWYSVYGPAPENLDFKCIYSESKEWECTMNGVLSDHLLLKSLQNERITNKVRLWERSGPAVFYHKGGPNRT